MEVQLLIRAEMCGNPPLSHPKNIGIKMITRPLLCHASGQRKRQAQPAILEISRISCPALQVSHALIYELFTALPQPMNPGHWQ